MTELDRALIGRKLAVITRNLRDLASVERLSLEEYRSERFRQKGIERLLQETIEAAVDINLHLLRAAGHPAPPDYFESFIQLGRSGVLPVELAEGLAPAAGLRNRLVHEYDAIDDVIVLQAVGQARENFAAYAVEIEKNLAARQ